MMRGEEALQETEHGQKLEESSRAVFGNGA